jgi:hypothetical protein
MHLPSTGRGWTEHARLLLLCVAATALVVAGCEDDPVVPPEPPPIDSPEDLIQTLSRAYQQRDPDLFASILANDTSHNAEFLFLLSDPTPDNETQWGYVEEARIHQRMFRPHAPPPGDPPVPPEIWLQSLTITLTLEAEFAERTDLYTSEGGYLDRAKWRANSATYSTYLLFELAGDTDYRIEGRADFVVIDDLEKDTGDPGKFLILIWEDLGSQGRALLVSEENSWASIKRLYR